MKILHTSDWHLGQNFKSRSREGEHTEFLSWLTTTIEQENIDTLIVAGDIFDSANPPKYALTMYNDFLVNIVKTSCKDVIIIAGNHDSIATIEMTKNLAKVLNIHIVASGENIDETLISLTKDGELQAVVCAVPFLRDRVLRDASSTKNNREIEEEFKEGMKNYYANIYKRALELSSTVPIIATGHFTTTGASVNPDSEREIYIGKLASVDSTVLGSFDYVAMGHLHSAQKVGKSDNIRYSGSPIPLSFSEHNQQKRVLVVSFENNKLVDIQNIDIPSFKGMYRVQGDMKTIQEQIESVKNIDNRPFFDVILNDDLILNADLTQFRAESYDIGVDIVSLKRQHIIDDKVLTDVEEDIKLSELDTLSVFEKRMGMEETINEDKELQEKLIYEYKIILEELNDEDK